MKDQICLWTGKLRCSKITDAIATGIRTDKSGKIRFFTKREIFLNAMDEIIPWQDWEKMIAPYDPSGKRRRPPLGIELMLRMYLLQNWFNLSDEGIELSQNRISRAC